ncbi:hypothetical protein [Nocardia sp. alder85J]|uniref:hypothetical protein n=1 Tax=Nocardia sp. alder85J TaxID=2862949 RepID=UPI001CD261F4|nr:hypothetical protein [Nocardia sp. alder85J]MCX4091062.1 hypothetical protein [Nocardia sp. alder85J]
MTPAQYKRAVSALAVLIADWEKKNLSEDGQIVAEPNPPQAYKNSIDPVQRMQPHYCGYTPPDRVTRPAVAGRIPELGESIRFARLPAVPLVRLLVRWGPQTLRRTNRPFGGGFVVLASCFIICLHLHWS